MWSRRRVISAIGGTLLACTCALRAAEVAPATVPVAATQPAGVAVRGRVTLEGGWALQKPDLTRVVVYLASDPALDAASGAPPRATVAQKSKTFVPNFAVVPLGTEVEFPNWDNFDHNVFSRSKAAPAFDLDRYPRGMSKTRTFGKLGVVQVFCNIHPEMRAVIFVTPNRFFARADAEGNFQITGVPPGRYELVAWNERCGEQRQPIDISTGAAADVAFTLKESRERAVTPEAPRHSTYGGVERGLGVKRQKLNLPVVTEAHPATQESQP